MLRLPANSDLQMTWYNTSHALWMAGFSIQQLLVTWILVGILAQSPETVGLAQLLIGVPALIFMLWGGVIGDQVDGTIRVGSVVVERLKESTMLHTQQARIQFNQAATGTHVADVPFERNHRNLVSHDFLYGQSFFAVTPYITQSVGVDMAHLGRCDVG